MNSQNNYLDNKTIVITGASKGIGAALAEQLAAQFEVNLVLISSSLDNLKQKFAHLPHALLLQADVRVQADVRHAIHQAIDTFGQIDILVNNAGMGKFAPATQVELTDYDQMFDVNVKGSFICAQAVVPHLQTQQSGHIVCVCSDVSHRTFVGGSVYCATKYAQEALTNALRKELRPQGIKVSGVYPGQTDTEFGNTTQGAAHKAAWLRAGDVADAIIYIINTPPHLLIDELQLHPISQEF